MGTKGTRLDVKEAPNQAPLGSSLTAYQRLPIADAGNFTFDDPVGNSIYHAMQVRITRRFQRGISTNFFYTFSKAIDDIALAQNFYDQAAERGLSAADHRQAITANWVLASPVDATRGFLAHPAFLAKALKDRRSVDSYRERRPGWNGFHCSVTSGCDGVAGQQRLRLFQSGRVCNSRRRDVRQRRTRHDHRPGNVRDEFFAGAQH
jgi:hypothetical protein